MLDPNVISLLQKVQPITPEQISQFSFMLFGTGGYAKSIYQQHASKITAVIEHEAKITHCKQSFADELISPLDARGNVLIGSDIGNFQYNQLQSLTKSDHSQIDKILLVDPYIHLRKIDQLPAEKTIVLLEHASGVARHEPLLRKFKGYFEKQGMVVTSLCPLTLYHYSQYFNCRDVIMFSGQRALYDIGREVFSHKKLTYMEYGFFPQVEHFYLDKLGVNQDSSLMTDDLNWIESKHIDKLNGVKSQFLSNFTHQSSDYILVPLQVPDDPNIAKCSRFTNGMQEFIDYIVSCYPSTQKIVFKAHPKDPNKDKYDYRGKESSNLPFLVLLERAESVHGITSSTLYEATLAGIDIETEGRSLLASHHQQKEKLLAAMVDRQISRDKGNPNYVVSNYSNLISMGK